MTSPRPLAFACSPPAGDDPSASLRAGLPRLRAGGFAGITLDAARPGLRPRELDRSARRDLAAALRRADLGFAGLDLWIPPDHFAQPEHQERALSAALSALELAADLRSLAGGVAGPSSPPSVALVLPDEPLPDVIAALVAGADRVGVRLADYAVVRASAAPTPAREPGPWGVGLDAAALLARGGGGAGPDAGVLALGPHLAQARLSDWSGIARVAPGSGRLDLLAYAVALSTAATHAPVVLDLRGVAAWRAPVTPPAAAPGAEALAGAAFGFDARALAALAAAWRDALP